MRYVEYMKRSMNELTTEAWEAMLSTSDAPTFNKTVLVDCPCCRSVMAIDVGVGIRTIVDRCEIQTHFDSEFIPSDGIAADSLSDTQLEMAAMTQTDLIAV